MLLFIFFFFASLKSRLMIFSKGRRLSPVLPGRCSVAPPALVLLGPPGAIWSVEVPGCSQRPRCSLVGCPARASLLFPSSPEDPQNNNFGFVCPNLEPEAKAPCVLFGKRCWEPPGGAEFGEPAGIPWGCGWVQHPPHVLCTSLRTRGRAALPHVRF